jgi:hemoglobin
MQKKDIQTRDDLIILLESFYQKAKEDGVIGHFFTTVIPLDFKEHIPVVADFWETILLTGHSYKKNAIAPHMHINEISRMEEKHFTRWLKLFSETLDELFSGDITETAKQRALSIATIMRIKLSNSTPINISK